MNVDLLLNYKNPCNTEENNKNLIILEALKDNKNYGKPGEKGLFRWYVTNDPNSKDKTLLQSGSDCITLECNEIGEKYKNQWLYCECIFSDGEYLDGCFFLTDDLIEIIKKNQFSKLFIYDEKGNISARYISNLNYK